MPKCVRRTAATASAGPLTSTCAAACRPKRYEQELARLTAEESRRRHPPSVTCSLVPAHWIYEPATVKTPTQIATTAANVSPQRGIHCGREASRPVVIRPAYVLVMDEELVEIRQRANPSDAEEPAGGPDRIRVTSRGKSVAPGQSGPTPFGELLERTGQHEAAGRRRDRVPAARGGRRDRGQSSPREAWAPKGPARRTDHRAPGRSCESSRVMASRRLSFSHLNAPANLSTSMTSPRLMLTQSRPSEVRTQTLADQLNIGG